MKKNLLIGTFALVAIALAVSCNKNNSDDPTPTPTPEETYTVTVASYFTTKSFSGSVKTQGKMLDVYKEKGFIEDHYGTYSSAFPVILEKTGVAKSDVDKVYSSLQQELTQKLKTSAQELNNMDWTKTFGTDSFHLGYLTMNVCVPGIKDTIKTKAFCAIPEAAYETEYTTEDTTMSLEKFVINKEMYDYLGVTLPTIRTAKATLKGKGERDFVAGLGSNGSVTLTSNDSTITYQRYILQFDKPSSGKEMTLRYISVGGAKDTVSVKYKCK